MEKHLVVSIHDFTPKFQSELEEVLEELDLRGIDKRTIMVIPRYEGEYLISGCSETARLLREERQKEVNFVCTGILILKRGKEESSK